MNSLSIDKIRTNGGTQSRVQLDWEVTAEYATAMHDGVAFPPVIVFHDGTDYWLADGFHRIAAAQQAGLSEFPAAVRQGTRRDAMLHSVGANANHGVRRTNADKRVAVMLLLNDPEWVQWSDREIARQCGVAHPMVSALRPTGRIFQSNLQSLRTGADGRTINTANIGKRPDPVSEFFEDEPEEYPESVYQYGDAYCKYCYTTHTDWEAWEDDVWMCQRCEHSTADAFMGTIDDTDDDDEISQDRKDEIDFARTLKPHVADNIKDGYRLTAANHIVSDTPGYDGDEWYTPTEFIDAARNVMGTIDLDPASCIEAQSTINAAHFFTKDDDGLSMGWFGNVWLNPPYSNPLINQFVEKLIDEYESERINSAIILTNNSSDTKWFHLLLSRYPACFIRGRVHFWRQNHDTFGARQGQTIFYLGKDILKFETHFSGLGQVVMKI